MKQQRKPRGMQATRDANGKLIRVGQYVFDKGCSEGGIVVAAINGTVAFYVDTNSSGACRLSSQTSADVVLCDTPRASEAVLIDTLTRCGVPSLKIN